MKELLRQELGLFLLAVQFLTRLPVPKSVPFSDDLVIRSTKFYPLVGILVGAIGAAVLALAAQVLPPVAAVILSLAATLLATGAFHEDGLADSADGLVGGRSGTRRLEIMRDSRIGSYGAVALGVVLSLKVALLSAVPLAAAAALLLAGHGLSRMAAVHVIATTRYARKQGTKFAAPTVTPDGYRIALANAFVILIFAVLALGPMAALVGGVIGIGVSILFRNYFLRRIGGYTGDCLGGVQQLSELGFYLGAVACL